MPNHTDLTELRSELSALRAQVSEQAAQLAELQAEPASKERRVSRRHLLSGLAGLGAAGVAGLATAPSAAAADGDALLLGEQNDATTTTVISTDNGLLQTEVRFGEFTSAITATSPDTAVVGEIPGDGLAGVWGRAIGDSGFGLLGTADVPGAFGLAARSAAGPAILAVSEVDGVAVQLEPAERTGPPTALADGLVEYRIGSLSFDTAGDLWVCVATGSPGTWTRLLREDTAAGRVIPITPFRALDTRATGGRASGAPAVPGQTKGPLAGRQSVTLDIAGSAGIPATASGVVGNATVITPSAAGLLRILPAGAVFPASSLNFNKAENIANGFTSALSESGLRVVAPTRSTTRYHLVLDIAAYIT